MDTRFRQLKTFDSFDSIVEYTNFILIQPSTYGLNENQKTHLSVQHNSEYSLHFILSGRGFITYEGYATVQVKAGDLFFLLPYNRKITYYADAKNPWSYCYINFSGNITHILSKLNISAEKPFIHPSHGKEIKNIFYSMFTSLEKYHAFSNFICHTTINNILFSLLTETDRTHTAKKYSSHVTVAQKYIEEHYQDSDLTMEAVAQHCALNATYFSKLFRQKTGVNFSSYLTNYRIRIATSLIHQGLDSVHDVAEAVGFSSQYYFSNQFLKIHHIRPKEYIRQVQELERNKNNLDKKGLQNLEKKNN